MPERFADSLTRQLDTCRFKLKTATSKTASRAAKGLERRVESQDDEIADLRLTLRRSHERQERIEKRHQDEINWLKQDIDRERSRIAKVYREGERVAGSLRKQFDRQLAAARRPGGGPGGARSHGCASVTPGCGRRSCGPPS